MDTGVGGLMAVVWIFITIAGIMAIFIPFWVFRIRNEIIETNRRLSEIARLLKPAAAAPQPSATSPQPVVETKPPSVKKVCPECGHSNEDYASMCMACRQRLD